MSLIDHLVASFRVTPWVTITEIMEHVAVSAAVLVGGVWALFRFRRERTDEPALRIEVTHSDHHLGDQHLVGIAVALTNIGKTHITAKPTLNEAGFAYDDGVERLRQCCGLQIRRLKTGLLPVGHLDWFGSPSLEQIAGLSTEINVLSEYENPRAGYRVDFYMEPGETYHLEVPVILPSGVYLGKVTFVAAGQVGYFWSRLFTFTIPAAT